MRRATVTAVCCITLSSSIACGHHLPSDPSLTHLRPGVNPNVENGTAFDKAEIPVGDAKKIILPDDTGIVDAKVVESRRGWINIYMEKDLAYVGHPPERMSIRDLRRAMGCVTRVDGDTLIIQPYGAWHSTEGGAGIRLLVEVPPNLPVERRKLPKLHVLRDEPDPAQKARHEPPSK